MEHNISGVLLLDKPVGPTSNEALQIVKKLFKSKKAGHTGSLDPIASGMLPICFGNATKFSQFLLESDKCYQVTGKLGETTASGDSETPVLATKEVGKLYFDDFEKVLIKYRGNITQIPPMYSAIKYNGQPLYKLIRNGIEIVRTAREIKIYSLKLNKFENNLLNLHVHCSKGTYIRTLIEDIGKDIGCGAHVVALRRISVGHYKESEMVSLDYIKQLIYNKNFNNLNKLILPIESILKDIPELILTPIMIFYLSTGTQIFIPGSPQSGIVKFRNKDNVFLGIGQVLPNGKIASKKMINL